MRKIMKKKRPCTSSNRQRRLALIPRIHIARETGDASRLRKRPRRVHPVINYVYTYSLTDKIIRAFSMTDYHIFWFTSNCSFSPTSPNFFRLFDKTIPGLSTFPTFQVALCDVTNVRSRTVITWTYHEVFSLSLSLPQTVNPLLLTVSEQFE